MSVNGSWSCHNESDGGDGGGGAATESILHVCTYSFICIVGLVFNLTALAVFCSGNRSRSQTTIYMTNLAAADTLLILTLPLRIYHHLGYRRLPLLLCEVLGLVLKANMYGSIFLLTCISADRCLAVCFPLSGRVQDARRKAPLVCLGIWVFTFGASLPIYLSKAGRAPGRQCFGGLPVYAIRPAVVLPTLALGFVLPLVLMLLCSWGLVRAVRRSAAAQTPLVDSRKIYRMVATNLLVFLVSFLPHHAALLLLALRGDSASCPLLAAYSYSLMVACLNTVLDPVAYYFTTDTFKRRVDLSTVQRMLPMNSQSSEVNRNRGHKHT